MANLTPKQQKIYDFIRDFSREYGYPPTVREIGEHLGLKSPSTVKFHLDNLRAAGLIQWDGGKTRSITLLEKEDEPKEDMVPVLGNVAAGSPILAQECIEEYVSFQTGPHPEDYFALKVRANPCSMRASSPTTWWWSAASPRPTAARSWWPSSRTRLP